MNKQPPLSKITPQYLPRDTGLMTVLNTFQFDMEERERLRDDVRRLATGYATHDAIIRRYNAFPALIETLEQIRQAHEDYIRGDTNWDAGFEQFIDAALAKARA